MPHAVFVDVSPAVRAAIDHALEGLGIARGHVANVADAGALVASRRADLLVTPTMEVARAVLDASADGVATAVLVCTEDRIAAAEALRGGADGVIDPRDPSDLAALFIHRAIERSQGRKSLPSSAGRSDPPRPLEEVAREAAEEAERRHILSVLASVRGNRTRAASLLGVARSTLWHKLRRYGLEAGSPDSSEPLAQAAGPVPA